MFKDARDLIQAPLHAERKQILDLASEMDAATLDGVKARLRMIMAYEAERLTGSDRDDLMVAPRRNPGLFLLRR